MSFVRQLLCTIVVSCSSLTVGVVYTWPSSTVKLFLSENTTLHRPMSDPELALVGSLSSIGAFIATPVAAFLLDWKGRRFSIIIFSSMHVICWAMVIISNRVEMVLAALFVSGLGCGAFFVTPVYISDFCEESVRGRMTSGFIIFYAMGTIVSYALGGLLDFYPMVYACLGISVAGVLLLGFMKESPLFLMMKGREQEAKESLAFFRNIKPDSKEALYEIETIRRGLNPELDDVDTPEEESTLKLKPAAKKKLSLLQFFRKSYSTRRALATAVTLTTLSVFQGLVGVQVFAEPLFTEAIPTMSATWCSILFSVVTVIAGLVAAYLTDVAGRRPLMMYSSLCTAVCCVLLGSQIHLHWGPHSVTAVLIYSFCVVYTMGAGTVPYVMSPELFLPEVKGFCTMMVTEWMWLCSFVILFVFNPLVAAIGLGPVFYIFAVVCLAAAAFTYFFLPETKGLPVDAIQALFAKKRSKATV